ncbi:Hint domain-containing protein [Maribius pontilimi]|uniref:Hint domain-containing protein n=1 Tax=Palleronia pontilimi TaxID=1964209 RepID=A0A934MCI4_9RHOB|nr:Hint domain-containing protein [Palleronia pontilimi]MBJ3762540.1 Hint domain-containing protein [Palleronia pontilimi]
MSVHISEVSYSSGVSTDFVEIAADNGTDLSGYSIYVYTDGGLVLEGPYSLGNVQATIAGTDVYVLDDETPDFGGITKSYGVALVDGSGDVVQFISFDGNTITASEGPANGQSSTNIGAATLGRSLQSDDGGNSYYTQDAPNRGTVPCYAAGTLIDTLGGAVPIETLKPGDLVLTRDRGPRPILWTRSEDYPLENTARYDRPVLIKAGAVGPNLPARDMVVSPQHRVLVGSGGQFETIFDEEALAPAKALVGLLGIRHMMGKKSIRWIHFACARHEVVRANGCWAETLLLGRMVVDCLTPHERRALRALFPKSGVGHAWNGRSVRPCLSVGDARRAIAEIKPDLPIFA